MTPALVLSIVIIYFSMLILISIITGKDADTNTFFTTNRQSPWYMVTYRYFKVARHWVLIKILMPLYPTLNFVSIHTPSKCGLASGIIDPVPSLHYPQGLVYIKVLSHCLQLQENQTSLFPTHY